MGAMLGIQDERKEVGHVDDLVCEMVHICKRFPGVRALHDVTFSIRRGEVHGLVGENGAGKSTLIKILGGINQKDSGEIRIDGVLVDILSPYHSQQLGISVIPQELILAEGLTVAQNVFLGQEPGQFLIRSKEMEECCCELLREWGIDLHPDQRVSDLSVAERQMVLILKAVSMNTKIIVMDEPTARLTGQEKAQLFQMVGRLKARGISTVYISHHLDEVFELCDRVTVLRDGQAIETLRASEASSARVISLMVGRELKDQFPKVSAELGPELLRVDHICCQNRINDVSFGVRRGEILGISGLVGSGRSSLVHSIFGSIQRDSGKIYISGREVSINSPRDAVACGIALVPEERRHQGIVLSRSVGENISLAGLSNLCRAGLINRQLERHSVSRCMDLCTIKAPSPDSCVAELSGGNQQKVVIAKWLESRAEIFLFDEPTRGIDVGAKAEIYRLMGGLVKKGAAVVMVSSELPEILGISDRILVMRNGGIVAELDPRATCQEEILSFALGGEAS
jgi:ribose transport system ATP-binding protein